MFMHFRRCLLLNTWAEECNSVPSEINNGIREEVGLSLPDLRELTMFDSTLREGAKDSNELKSAIRLAQEELEKAEEIQHHEAVIQLLGYLGNACRISNLLGESVKYLERAVLLCRTIGDRKAELVNTIRLAEARKYNGELSIAEELLRTALKWTNEEGFSAYKDFVLQHLGKCRLEQGAPDDAIRLLEEALELRIAKEDSELINSTELALQMARNTEI
jgi:tetratricopeptide (TPR) repeat protein